MPHKFPPHIKEWLQTYAPPTHKIWWMRTLIQQIEPRTKAGKDGFPTKHYFRLVVRDIDAPPNEKQAYEFDIDAEQHRDFRLNDRLSVFGHEEHDATNLTDAQMFFSNETYVLGSCYHRRFLDRDVYPLDGLKIYLPRTQPIIAWERATGAKRNLLTNVSSILNTATLANFNMYPLYKALSHSVSGYVFHHPDPNYPCVNPRPENQHKGGSLVD